MAGNDYRNGKSVLHVVVDDGLYGVVKELAVARGVSITRLVTELLEDACMTDPQPVQALPPVSAAPQAVPDWDSIMERGRAARVVVVSDTVLESDPLEEIA